MPDDITILETEATPAAPVPGDVPGSAPSVQTPPPDNGAGTSVNGAKPQTVDGASDEALRQFTAATGKTVEPNPAPGAIPVRPVAPPRFNGKTKGRNSTPRNADTPKAEMEVCFPIKPEEIDDLVNGVVGMLNDAGAGLIKQLAKRNGLEAGTVTELAEATRMTPATEAMLKKGASACAKKYLLNYQFLPEAMVGIGLCVWGAGVWVQVKAIKDFKAQQPAQ